MCQIIVGNRVPQDLLTRAAQVNPDGVGVAVRLPSGLWRVHRAMQYRDIAKPDNNTCQVWHFRLASRGKVNLRNCQPVAIAPGLPQGLQEETGEAFLCHNGTLRGLGGPEFSDTVELAQILAQLPREEWEAFLTGLPGRFALLTREGVKLIGHWHRVRGCWVSNPACI